MTRTGGLYVLLAGLLAVPLGAQQDVDVERGFKPGQVFESGARVDAVNLFSGTVNLAIPVSQTYTVGGTLSYSFVLHGATSTWDSGTHQVDSGGETQEYGYTFPWKHSNAGHGWILSLGKIHRVTPLSDEFWYVAADGTQHQLYYTLHGSNPAEIPQSDVRYTRDGTYLRFRIFSNRWELHFPNGHVHTFDTDGRLTKMEDPFGNFVAVTYSIQMTGEPHGGSTRWTITDSIGREHRVYFRPGPSYVEDEFGVSVPHELVHRLDVTTFDGSTAQYQFAYENETSGWSQVSRRCTKKNDPDMQVVNAALLTTVTLSGYLQYSMSQYDKGNQSSCSSPIFEPEGGGASGNLKKLILPTGASIEWTYRKYTFTGYGSPSRHNAAIGSRTVKDQDGTILSETTYVPEIIPLGGTDYDSVRIVTEKDASFRTKHYFGSCRTFSAQGGCRTAGYYGLPVTTTQSLDGAYLSSEIQEWSAAQSAWQTRRRTYRKYAADYYLDSGTQQGEHNQRLSFEKTVYEDGSSSQTTYAEFDGLGNWRSVTTTGSWGNQDSRTTHTNSNPAAGEYTVNASHVLTTVFTLPALTGRWLLTTYDTKRVTESRTGVPAATSETGFCFDTLGFLTSTRTYKNAGASPAATANDLLAVFTRDSGGNLVSEQYVGGDNGVGTLSPVPFSCGTTLGAETYRIEHRYSNGARARSYYTNGTSPLTFFLMDRDVDFNTGLTARSREASTPTTTGGTSGESIATDYEYDLLGRLTDVIPVGIGRRAKTSYTYTMNPPSVVVREIDGSTTLTNGSTSFDGLGRVRSESRTMPGGSTASRSTDYNFVGQKIAERGWGVSEPTTFIYDIFGRIKTISAPVDTTTPGGATTTLSYTGAQTVERTVAVRTGGPGTSTQFTAATTTEEYDPLGRLWRVTEPPPSVGGSRPVTEYTYDIGGRLTKVCSNKSGATCGQTRELVYDNRGLLQYEKHPEKGPQPGGNGETHYADYDARGHAGRRYEGSAGDAKFDVGFTFDRAERLARVHERSSDRTLKSFVFGTSNTGGNWKNGRLVRSVGYNWLPIGIVVKVVEDHDYSQADGLLSGRTTWDVECTSSLSCEAVETGTKRREFVQSFTYNKLGLPMTLGYPDCTAATHDNCAGATSDRTITNTYSHGRLTGVTWNGAPATSTISYHPQGAVNQVVHGNGVVDTQELDVGGRLSQISTTNAIDGSSCVAPTFTTQPESQTIASGSSTTLVASASGENGMTITYQWYRGNVGDTSNAEGSPSTSGTRSVTPVTTTTYWVRATNGCSPGSADSSAAVITVCNPPAVTSSPASKTITRGQSTTLSVTGSGSTPLRYQWYTVAGTVATAVNGAEAGTLSANPAATTTYRVVVTNDCGEATSQNATVTVVDPPSVPSNVRAVADGTRIRIDWNASASAVGISSYTIVRQPGNVSLSANGLTAFDSAGLVTGAAYVYTVRAVDANGAESEASSAELAVYMTFVDDPVSAGQTPIKGIHVGQLRQAIDGVRELAGLGTAWSSYAVPTGSVMASHFTEMRARLNEARVRLGFAEVVFTDPVASGMMIRASQLTQLRGGVK